MKYGFLIDNRRCIGCHACSTACKSENEVPLGVHRTWVKYTETGKYPDATRHFQVTRCNHCENAPCARICPVTAMYQRDDGIVEFDSDACIGCKACIQACPYDAIHIDPEKKTASKCHFCSHRVDIGLEPACVVVCPEHAIIAGDMDNPDTEISKMLAKEKVTVRKPEQGTAPKLFYVDGHDASLVPTATDNNQNFLWSENMKGSTTEPAPKKIKVHKSKIGLPEKGNFARGENTSEHMVQVAYNAEHKIYWHWQVPAYIVTKDISTGVFMIAAFLTFFFTGTAPELFYPVLSAVSLVSVLVTTVLLVADLEHPLKFLSILYRPQWKSWLTRGAYILVAFSLFVTGWTALEWGVYLELLAPAKIMYRESILIVGLPLSMAAAVYTAFLFGQAEGRDLWQQPLLPLQLFVRAIICGSAAGLIAAPFIGAAVTGYIATCGVIFFFFVGFDLFLSLFCEFAMPHSSNIAAKAAQMITKGRYKRHFWVGFIMYGNILPLWMCWRFVNSSAHIALAGIFGIVGIFIMEYIFVMAPQRVANS